MCKAIKMMLNLYDCYRTPVSERQRMLRLFLATACILFIAHTVRASEGDAMLGIWLTEEQDAAIKTFKCRDNNCGRIVLIQ